MLNNTPPIVDTHAHLVMDAFAGDMEAVLDRAADAGVSWVLVPSTDVDSARQVVRLCESESSVYGAVGVHPHDADKAGDTDMEAIASMLLHPRVCAVGEIGMDFHYSFSSKEAQERVFSMQLALARVNDMPVIIHSREAVNEILAIIDAVVPDSIEGVFHCFTGSHAELEAVLEHGFYVSVGGMVTFKNGKIAELAGQIPLDRLLIETDAPYLTPVPLRGKRNEPAYLVHVIEKLAQIYDASFEQIARQTAVNAGRLFGTGYDE